MAQTQQPGDGDDRAPEPGPKAERAQEEQRPVAPGEDAAPTPTGGDGAAHQGRGTDAGAPAPSAAAHTTPGRGAQAVAANGLSTVGDGRYRLTHRLGRGGMAEVYAAEDVRLGRSVAVKLLRSDLAEDSVARLRFTREAHAVAALNHHAIVAVYDTGEEETDRDSVPYIVMELVEGRTVRDLLVDEEAPPVDQALVIIAGVLEALAYSHGHGIVHRDIKPANVIITTAGAVKVMDFGIARALAGGASTMTQTGMVMGTPQYLSPEQALGKTVDHRSDLYATGCMLYELLTLRPPFTGDTPLAVVYQHVQDVPRPPSQVDPQLPPQLDALVLRALAKDPDDRFQSAEEFRAHVQQALRAMHGEAGAYAPGPAAAATVGLAAAGGAYAATQKFGAASPTGGTTVSPGYGPHTPPMGVPAAGTGAPWNPPGGRAPEGGPDRRRLLWLALAATAVVAAVVAFVAVGQSGGDTPSGTGTSFSPTAHPSVPTDTPTTETPTQTSSGSQYQNGGGSHSGRHHWSPTPASSPSVPWSVSPSAPPSGTPSESGTPSAPVTEAPTSSTPTSEPSDPGPHPSPTGGDGGTGLAGGTFG